MVHFSLRKTLLCCSIALNALCAGGMFTFPLMSPYLATYCKLTQPQLTTIVLAGMMSQYTIAALVGLVIDNHGPAVCSLIAALLFVTGFGGFATELYSTPPDLPEPRGLPGPFYRLTFCFFFVGLATVFAYFSSLFAASKTFPNHLGLASGTSMALFGISPLFLSVIATTFFTDAQSGVLAVTQFTTFLAFLTGTVYVAGFLFLRNVPQTIDASNNIESQGDSAPGDENTPLLSSSRTAPSNRPPDLTVFQLIGNLDFWLLAIYCILILGASEMVISNIGTIVISLPLPSDGSTTGVTVLDSSAAFQVKLISAANTLGRLVVGPLADFVSPIAAYLHAGLVFPRKHRISRFAFLSGAGALLSLTFLWLELGVKNRSQMWMLSLGTGFGYSAVFTILPSLISSLWGMQNMGRNFGIMMYAPFVGTPMFSYFYAFISAKNTESGVGICTGRACWRTTFYLAIATSCSALIISAILWRRWRDRI